MKPFLLSACLAICPVAWAADPSVADYASVQEAVDRNPGLMVFVPAGDHVVTKAISLRHDGSGLWGPGRIVASNPEEAIVVIDGARDVQLRDLILTRPEGRMETHQPGIRAMHSANLRFSNVQVIDNRGDLASIYVWSCNGVRIENCLVLNYSRISVDDRRRRPNVANFDLIGGYAFNTISGTGIGVRASQSVLIQGNRVIETIMIPTPVLKEKHRLGTFSHKDPVKGSGLSQEFWDSGYNNGWHQGSAIALANAGTDPFVQTNPFIPPEPEPPVEPDTDHYYQVIGNYIENAAQGMDIHVDHALISQNIVNNSFIGMKAVHGARNVVISANQFLRNDLCAIMLMPGTTSHPALTGRAPNIDGHSVVANNIISDFGYGNAHWIWQDADPTPLLLNLNKSQPLAPALADVIVTGNVIYDTGRDQILVDGKPQVQPPRYHYAVKVGTGAGSPQGLHFTDNLFHPGTAGIANTDLNP